MGQILRVFKSTIPSISYLYKDGVSAVFQFGVHRTADEKRIAELEAEINAGHPHIYIDPAEREIDEDMINPENVLRAKLRAEILAELQDPTRDMGSYTPQELKPSSTADISTAAIDSTVGASAAGARLTSLKK